MPASYLSYSASAILQAVAHGYVYGFEVMDITGLPSGTVYPALRRMEDSGLIASEWEKAAVAQTEQRPRRKYYAITRSGQLALAEAATRYRLADLPTARRPRSSPARS